MNLVADPLNWGKLIIAECFGHQISKPHATVDKESTSIWKINFFDLGSQQEWLWAMFFFQSQEKSSLRPNMTNSVKSYILLRMTLKLQCHGKFHFLSDLMYLTPVVPGTVSHLWQ